MELENRLSQDKGAMPTDQASVYAALVKKVRVEYKDSTKPQARALDAVLLCSELLRRAGTDPSDLKGDPTHLAQVLAKEYSPEFADTVFRIAGSLDVATVFSDVEDDSDSLTGSSETGSVPETDSLVDLKALSDDSSVDEIILKEETAATNSKAYKKETEIAMSRIFELGKVAPVADPSIAPFDPYHGPSVVTMSGFGELGRFGNQVLQYAFLRCYALKHNIAEVQVPAWAGAGLFGLTDRAVQRALPAVIEDPESKANSTFTSDFMNYIKASNGDHPVQEVSAQSLTVETSKGAPLKNVDFWGWFQWHSSCYAPFKNEIQQIFTPVDDIESHLQETFNAKLRFKGGVRRTVVGLHLRLGDYKNISASSFGYCAPTSWYLELLEKIWPELENPVLFVASDDVEAVLKDFAAYEPVTADMLGIEMPASRKNLKAGFFPDWWSLTQCDVLAISNSTFSFTACMMNKQPSAKFYRAHYADRMVEIDPWNSDPIVHRDMTGNALSTTVDTLRIVYNTQGTAALLRNLLVELPCYGARAAIMKVVLWREARVRSQSAEAVAS